ncbi:acyl-CoA dehydrogenase family protein [candidate division CSSED10-310 bacterium]|uniref:Acyl-CoA dehydrogenase family protein n=1 Tax=candidate division CSSED10-310 bacterium TaxID=2855610 RepID=A0ABV6YYX2_UNCC1
MVNFFSDNKDLQYYVEKGLDWEPLIRLTEYENKAVGGFESNAEALEFYSDILDLVGKLAANEIAPIASKIDKGELILEKGEVTLPAVLQELFDNIKELGLHGMCVPRELGGMNCPLILYYISSELIARGDVSVMAHYGFHGGIAMAMLMYSLHEGTTEFQRDPPQITKTRFEKEIAEIISGQAWGSMDITEPNAGSDMGALLCQAEQDQAGNWFVSGQKILITSGHGKYHFVIARTEKGAEGDSFAGLKGLSLFLVPAYEEDEQGERRWLSSLDSLEKKLGHHGSVTVTISYDRTPAHLIGKRGDGFKQMLMLMNTARIGVGFESLGLCEAAWRMARDYAAERPSMGKMIDRHEIIADYLDEMETDIQGIRALCMYSAYHEEMAQKMRIKLLALPLEDKAEIKQIEREQRKHQNLSRMVTPLVKYFAAEKAVEMAHKCIQIHGGYGYSQDYGAEKLLRDAVVFPIYEGTSQIQALMAMKDNLGAVIKGPQAFIQNLAGAKVRSLVNLDSAERRVSKIQSLCYGAIQNLVRRVTVTKLSGLREVPVMEWVNNFTKEWDPKRDFAPAMLHAERLTQMLADKAICEILLSQSKQHQERQEVLERYLERAEPRVQHLYNVITSTGERLLDKLNKMEQPESQLL